MCRPPRILEDFGPVLSQDFFARPVLQVAEECIGKILVHQLGRTLVAGRVVEAEAYRGPEDLAAHSARGRRTARTEVMYGSAGHAYVFLLYGMHWNFNIVAAGIDEPHAVLIRALEPLVGLDAMSERRGVAKDRLELTNGPGKLCRALGIDRSHYGHDLTRGRGLYLLDAPEGPVARGPRIGIDYAGSWANKRWRFAARENRYVSKPWPWRTPNSRR
jgi:DNA-3-methyladenine glycosylase